MPDRTFSYSPGLGAGRRIDAIGLRIPSRSGKIKIHIQPNVPCLAGREGQQDEPLGFAWDSPPFPDTHSGNDTRAGNVASRVELRKRADAHGAEPENLLMIFPAHDCWPMNLGRLFMERIQAKRKGPCRPLLVRSPPTISFPAWTQRISAVQQHGAFSRGQTAWKGRCKLGKRSSPPAPLAPAWATPRRGRRRALARLIPSFR